MDSFEELVEQYTPMIHRILHSLSIYRNKDEFHQTALIALWEAQIGFDPQKGSFTNYAYSYIKGKLLLELTKRSQYEAGNVYPNEEYWEVAEGDYSDRPLELEQLLSYCEGLSKKETKWVVAAFAEDLSVKEVAAREKVSVSAVKQWKLSALKKLRASLALLK
ncbi:sigma-70 family RNA polymerase sigma factor [Bacillus sp. ISL-18]|uniref:sigma-70 family RNA polymerase sigma factor n=1 Tax=Bacillus sp. ISL-18 TaxID=2819118 RepID=UPI001BE877D6|nr:sigma-70 family RNA polymerase sigma factor [Bacillus sp. ISL-18]MBT2658810.1 sigma-70 family RNA polymerase sigma factor [Bacillus sp. ISL-18]